MAQLRKMHLFNCDRTYKLDAVESLLEVMKAKLGFDSVPAKHYFSLAEMPEMTHNTIPKLEMDMAFFVVHAHESRLSINEDNAGIGYAKIYRALLEATEGKVIIIIGGDDNYKNKDEEDRFVISRWARRKISSQFREEFLDGSKSFIFSWNKQHRAIHEEALLHYFAQSGKEGQKFEYQPKPKQPEGAQSAQTNQTSEKSSSSDDSKDAEPKEVSNKDSGNTEQSGKGSLLHHPRDAEQSIPGNDKAPVQPEQRPLKTEDNLQTSNRDQGARPKESPPLSIDSTKLKDLDILWCNVSDGSKRAVIKEFEPLVPTLNLSEIPTVKNLLPDVIKRYLMDASLKVCVLVVDGKTVKDAYENLPQQKEQYRELLETAATRVVEKVIVLICDTCSLPPEYEEIVTRFIEDIINRRGKGFIAWLKNGKLVMEPEHFAQVIMSTSIASQGDPKGSLSKEPRPAIGASGSVQEVNNPSPSISTGQPVMLKSKLRYGEISHKTGDVEIWKPEFVVPRDIIANLKVKYGDYPMAGVKIVNNNGEPRWFVEFKSKGEEGIEIADNETLMLKARIRKGEVSLKKGDLEFMKPYWEIPQYIRDSLRQKYWSKSDGELYIISDEQGYLRDRVHFGPLTNLCGKFKQFTGLQKQ